MIPILNNTERNFTTRDNLGITGATTTLQAKLCPVVNTVTPRAFYWPFMVWNYYEYHQYKKNADKSMKDFDKTFLKRNDYYFVLGNLLSQQSEDYLVGKTKTRDDIIPGKNYYSYNTEYFLPRYGGMQYYNAGCDTLGFITSESEGSKFDFPKITKQLGEPLALAFIDAVKNTEYYKNYRFPCEQVPTDVLYKWGERVNLSMNNLFECKRLLKETLFSQTKRNATLLDSVALVQHIYRTNSEPSSNELRYLLFQKYYEDSLNNTFPDELKNITVSWECVVARQYMTFALELIWKGLISVLGIPVSIDKWIEDFIKTSSFIEFSLSDTVANAVAKYNLPSDKIESMLIEGKTNRTNVKMLFELAFSVLASINNRYKNRTDIDSILISYGDEVSIKELIRLLEEFENKSIKEFLTYISENWIIRRHLLVAQEKMYYDRDAFYFHMNDGLCFTTGHDVSADFQGIRLLQLMQVMKDLDMFDE